MKRGYTQINSTGCINCYHLEQRNIQITNDFKSKIAILQEENAQLRDLCANLNSRKVITIDTSDELFSSKISAQDLDINNFEKYFNFLLGKFPLLMFVVQFFLSNTFIRKCKAKLTNSHWKLWSFFYRCFLLETILRSRNSKATLRLPLLLGLYFTYLKVPETAWRLLQRLKLIVSRKVVEDWVNSQSIPEIAENDNMFFSFDNCDFYRKVANVRSNHKSSYLHTATQFFLNLGAGPSVPASQILDAIDEEDFTDSLCISFDYCNKLANNAYKAMKSTYLNTWLKFAPIRGHSHISRGKIVILPPEMHCNTAKKVEIVRVLDKFWEKYVQGSERSHVWISGDQPIHNQLWTLKHENPEKWCWIVPIPGEWHWLWHIVQGIYVMYAEVFFLPISRILGFKSFDLKAKNYHYAEDFLQLLTIGLLKWSEKLMETAKISTPAELLHLLHNNCQVYELLYLLYYYLCPYWYTRSAIKGGKSKIITEMWKYWLHLFIAAKKYKYIQLSVRFLWTLASLHPSLLAEYYKFRVFSFSGEANTGIPIDAVNELVSRLENLHFIAFNNFHRLIGMSRA